MKKHTATTIILKRELFTWFSSFMSWLVTGLFLISTGLFFFSTFFIQQVASLRNFFSLLPILFAFFIPAITMRLFAEESRSGSLETLMTLPVSSAQAVAGKYLAAFISCAVMLLPTLSYALTAKMFGNPDAGPIIGGYLGALFLAAAYSAIGLFASASSKNQIVAFFIGFAICIILSIIDSFLIFLPAGITNFLSFFSANTHFESISKGIIDSRDLLYFISITVIFLGLTIKTEEGRRAA
ncbi:MAG: ABC transporter permease subunit [Treponemataceae bacterium]|nr:ABC transporter permease subunit [Treponemataceae bacterium]